MENTPAPVVFCTEDTVGLKDDSTSVGVIDRSFGDVDSHGPRPQKDYGEDIECHEHVSRDDFSNFMRTGIPPRGTVLVSWQSQLKTELVPETCLELLDRALYVGDVVKRHSKDPMSGTVIGTKAVCSLFPATMFSLSQNLSEELSIRNVPAQELINVHEYIESQIVVYGDWIGRVEQVFDEVAIKLSNNSVVVVEDPDDLEMDDGMLDRLSVGDTVKTRKGNLRRGRWRYGAYDPSVRPEGIVVETQPLYIDVHWLTRRLDAPDDSTRPAHEPPQRLHGDELNSPDFFVYDASGSAAAALPVSENGTDPSYHVAQVVVGDRVRFKDLTGAAVKYDGSKTLLNGQPQGKITRITRTETLGYDMNVYVIMQTHTQVTVQWQDLSVTEDPSPLLIPDPNVEDEDEVWPGEIIFTKEQRDHAHSTDLNWTFKPAKVGMVQAVKSRDRLATIRWFENPIIQFLGEDLIPPSYTGKLREDTEDVSLYDICSKPSLTRRRGDFVLVHPDAVVLLVDESLPTNLVGPNWFGEITDLGLDGYVTVRMGAAKPVVDVRVPIAAVTLAYSSDMDDPFMDGDIDDSDLDDDSDDSDDSASYNEMWIEYESMDGEALEVGRDEDWTTEGETDDEDEDEDEDADSDAEMPDLEPIEGTRTSDTTPEHHSDAEKKPSPLAEGTVDATSGDRSPIVEDTFNNDNETNTPQSFLVLETPPPRDHHYIDHSTSSSSTFMRRIAKEHKILRTSLPPDIFVRTWESRLDLLRILIIGPSDTPYEFAPFMVDFHLSSTYPSQAPSAFFHSWTGGNGPVNPNLYEDGKICLSLLGTWHSDERNESWSPTKSTLLQVLVSIMGLVLVKEPYYNEAGYDVHRAAPETKLNSALYTERAYFRARGFIAHALTHPVAPFERELKWLYRSEEEGAPRLLDKAIEMARKVLERSREGGEEGERERDGLTRVSLGATVLLKRVVERLEGIRGT
jgi:ubiquitin-conjugating enzyme E2 O